MRATGAYSAAALMGTEATRCSGQLGLNAGQKNVLEQQVTQVIANARQTIAKLKDSLRTVEVQTETVVEGAPAPRRAAPTPVVPGGEEADKCPTDFRPYDVSKAIPMAEIIGLNEAKERIRKDVIVPMRFPVVAKEQKLEAPNVLLYGPGGTGKTTLVEAVAKDLGIELYEASSGQIKGKFVGQSEKCLEMLLNLGRRGGEVVIFLDEVDALLAGDTDVERAFQGNFKQVVQPGKNMPPPVLMGATNAPWRITDDAIQRRFGMKLYISLPTPDQRVEYVKMLATQLKDCEGKARNLDEFTADQWIYIRDNTKGFTPDDLRNLFATVRRRNPKALSEEATLYFCEQPDKCIQVLLAAEAQGKSGCVRGLGAVLPAEKRRKICWPAARFEDFKTVLETGQIRAANTVETLQQFVDYAQKVKDIRSIPSIQRSIQELQS